MSTPDLVRELRRLPLRERLEVLEVTLHEIRQELDTNSVRRVEENTNEKQDQELREAAIAALPLYEANGELTAFTALDGEPFHDYEPR